MPPIYEYRNSPRRSNIVLAAFMFLFVFVILLVRGQATDLWLAWAGGAVLIGWMIMPRPVPGIQINDTHLILGAWRDPQKIALNDIAYIQSTSENAETDFIIMYKDGQQQTTFAGDMPDSATLKNVLKPHGIDVR